MTHSVLPDDSEIWAIVAVLTQQLERLDQIGAGIAAIHVDAAIQQLRSNAARLKDDYYELSDSNITNFCRSSRIRTAFTDTSTKQ